MFKLATSVLVALLQLGDTMARQQGSDPSPEFLFGDTDIGCGDVLDSAVTLGKDLRCPCDTTDFALKLTNGADLNLNSRTVSCDDLTKPVIVVEDTGSVIAGGAVVTVFRNEGYSVAAGLPGLGKISGGLHGIRYLTGGHAVDGVSFEGTSGNAIFLQGGPSNIDIQNCRFSDIGGDAIGCGVAPPSPTNLQVSTNVFRGIAGNGLNFGGSGHMIFANTFFSCGGNCLNMLSLKDSSVSGNTIWSTDANGVRIGDCSSGNDIAFNVVIFADDDSYKLEGTTCEEDNYFFNTPSRLLLPWAWNEQCGPVACLG